MIANPSMIRNLSRHLGQLVSTGTLLWKQLQELLNRKPIVLVQKAPVRRAATLVSQADAATEMKTETIEPEVTYQAY